MSLIIEYLENEEEVYDITVKDNNNFFGNNILVHNCNEIQLYTSKLRTAVCCLSSVNLEFFDEWKNTNMIQDLIRFLDNVLQFFIDFAPKELEKCILSATSERSLGLGAMGFHSYLQKNNIPFESGGFNSASQMNNIMFKHIHDEAKKSTIKLAEERGVPTDLKGYKERNVNLTAIAPTANNAILANTSPSIEPIASNAYTAKTRAGTYLVKNKHLEKWLDENNLNTDDIWQSIIEYDGSVQHLDIPDHIKEVYKTVWEIDQHWIIEHAEQRQKYISQSQSVNLFFKSGTDKGYINSVHLKAIRGRIMKGLYYFRTTAKGKVDNVKEISRNSLVDWSGDNTEDCLGCHG